MFRLGLVVVSLTGCSLIDAFGTSAETVTDGPAVDNMPDAMTDAMPDTIDSQNLVVARHWRLIFQDFDSSLGGSAVITEIQIRSSGAVQQIGSATLTSGGVMLDADKPTLTVLTDGVLAGSLDRYVFIATDGPGANIDIDLGAPLPIESILIAQSGFNPSPLEWTIVAFDVQSSDNGTQFTTRSQLTNLLRADWFGETLREFSVPPP